MSTDSSTDPEETVAETDERSWWVQGAEKVGGSKVLVLYFLPFAVLTTAVAVLSYFATSWLVDQVETGAATRCLIIVVFTVSQTYAFIGSMKWIVQLVRFVRSWRKPFTEKAGPAFDTLFDKAFDPWLKYLQERYATSPPNEETAPSEQDVKHP